MDLTLPRGVDDVEPERHALQARVRAAFEEVARVYNFRLMEPASLEHLATLRAKSGEDVDKEIYTFKDKGGRDVGLRFDMTVGIARYVCSRRDLKLPAKLAASGGIWRYDEPQYGRYRWSHQWDLEIFGPPSVESDAEVIDASSAILGRAGITDYMVKIGDRRLAEEFIRRKLGIVDDGRLVELMRALDKVEKKSAQELKSEYAAKGFEGSAVERLLEFGKIRGSPESVLSKAKGLGLDSTGELATLADSLRSRGVRPFEFNLAIVRGIDYYTGIVFEAADNKNPRLGSLFGGGRYDALPKAFGRSDLSATGAAGGIERMATSLAALTKTEVLLVYVAVAAPPALAEALKVQRALRDEGIPCELPLQPKPLSKQMEDASRLGAAWTVILGEKELRAGSVTLRDMKSRHESMVSLKEALAKISNA